MTFVAETATPANVFMGVSLSNKSFNRDFTKQLNSWLIRRNPEHVLIVIFDSCEVVNLAVFRGISQAEAWKNLPARTEELRSMFLKVLPENTEVTMQSITQPQMAHFPKVYDQLRRGFEAQLQFYQDVHKQIFLNLNRKVDRLGSDFIEKNIEQLSEYVLLELAWFYAWFKRDAGQTLEVYPGNELFTKRKLLRGEYKQETELEALHPEPIFLDISTQFANK